MVMTMTINVTFAFSDTLLKVPGIRIHKQNAESYRTELNFRQCSQVPQLPYCDSTCLAVLLQY